CFARPTGSKCEHGTAPAMWTASILTKAIAREHGDYRGRVRSGNGLRGPCLRLLLRRTSDRHRCLKYLSTSHHWWIAGERRRHGVHGRVGIFTLGLCAGGQLEAATTVFNSLPKYSILSLSSQTMWTLKRPLAQSPSSWLGSPCCRGPAVRR